MFGVDSRIRTIIDEKFFQNNDNYFIFYYIFIVILLMLIIYLQYCYYIKLDNYLMLNYCNIKKLENTKDLEKINEVNNLINYIDNLFLEKYKDLIKNSKNFENDKKIFMKNRIKWMNDIPKFYIHHDKFDVKKLKEVYDNLFINY